MIHEFCSITGANKDSFQDLWNKYENMLFGFSPTDCTKTVRQLRATMASEHQGTYKYTVTNL